MVLVSGDEAVVSDQLPVFARDVLEVQDGASEGVESPVSFDDACDGVGAGDRSVGVGRRRDDGVAAGGLGCGLVGYVEREGFADGDVGEDEAALIGVGGEGDVCAGAGAFEMEDEVVGVSRWRRREARLLRGGRRRA